MLNGYNLTKLVNWRNQIWGNKGVQVGSKDAKRVQPGHMVTTYLKGVKHNNWVWFALSICKEKHESTTSKTEPGSLTHTIMNQRVTWLTNLIRIHNKLNIQSQQAGKQEMERKCWLCQKTEFNKSLRYFILLIRGSRENVTTCFDSSNLFDIFIFKREKQQV